MGEAAHGIGHHATGLMEHRPGEDLPEPPPGFFLQQEKQIF